MPWPPSLVNSLVIADRDHKGQKEGPFTIWGSTASTKAQVSAKCANRRSLWLSLLLCGCATAGTVTLATWPSPLDLIVALEDREGAVPCSDSSDSIGNGIDYCSWTQGFVSVWALLKDDTNLWPWIMGTRWILYGSLEYFEWFMAMRNYLTTSRRKIQNYTVPLVPTPSQLHLTPLPCGGQRGF